MLTCDLIQIPWNSGEGTTLSSISVVIYPLMYFEVHGTYWIRYVTSVTRYASNNS